MKRLILILSVCLIACSKEDSTPQPKLTNPNTPSQTMATYNFNGNWDCFNWVVNDVTGQTHHRRLILSNQNSNSLTLSLNDYLSNGTFIQIITMAYASVDSNYFDNMNNPIQHHFKGVLTTDSTLMVYQYEVDGLGLIDTVQIKEFIKN